MKRMRKKSMIIFVMIILLAVGLSSYFRPLPLSDLLDEDDTIIVCQETVEIKNGTPDIDFQKNEDITEQQKNAISELFAEHTYRRKMNTAFSDGSVSNNDDYMYVFIYDGTRLKNTVVLTEDGEISINRKNYKLKEADDFIDQIREILSE